MNGSGNMDGKKGDGVLLGLSGGVDSAVAAWILKERGYPVEGLYLHNGFPPVPSRTL